MSQVQDTLEELQDLRGLVTHPGWARYARYLQENLEARRDSVELQECQDLVDLVKKEFRNGEIAGIRSMMTLIEVKINELGDIVDAYRRQSEDEENGEEEEN